MVRRGLGLVLRGGGVCGRPPQADYVLGMGDTGYGGLIADTIPEVIVKNLIFT